MSSTLETQPRSWCGWSRMEAGEMASGEVRKVMGDSSGRFS